jgi:XTP/dITP diphosphohydrolase
MLIHPVVPRLRTLLIATTNAGKIREIVPLLASTSIELLTLRDVPPVEPPEETGQTFEENARLKARAYSIATGLPTVAEDSGLEIDALDGAPGVESARFGGAGLPYPEKFALIYAALRAREWRRPGPVGPGVSSQDLTARFVCALALADGERVIFEARGAVTGAIAPEPRGSGGFGYDPIFFYPPLGCTLAEAGDRKADVSHRAEAFRKLRAFLDGLQM